MRKYITLISFLLAMTAAAQVQQRGFVKEYKGKDAKTSLGGVEVAVSRAGKTVTSSDGSFTLTFNTLKPGQKVNVIRIEKAGYEIFNKEAIEQWNINPDEPFTIVLCKSEEFRRLRDRYSEVSSASYAKQKAKEEARLSERLKKGEMQEAQYKLALEKLQADYEAKLSDIEEYADRFARIDLSEVSAIERDIVALVEQGDLDGAIAKYEEQDYLGKYAEAVNTRNAIVKMEQKATAMRDSMMAAVNNQISVYAMAGGMENQRKIKALRKGLADADTTDIYAVRYYALYCWSNQYNDEAIKYFEIYGRHASANLMWYHHMMAKIVPYDQALPHLEKAFEYELKEYEESQNVKKLENIIALRVNLVIRYLNTSDLVNAAKQIKLLEQIVDLAIERDPSNHDFYLDMFERTYINFHLLNNDYDKAEYYILRRIEYLVKSDNPHQAYYDLSRYHEILADECGKLDKAEEVMLLALGKAEELARAHNNNEYLASAHHYLGIFYMRPDVDKPTLAGEHLGKAVELKKELYNKDPRKHSVSLADMLYDLGEYLSGSNQTAKAADTYLECARCNILASKEFPGQRQSNISNAIGRYILTYMDSERQCPDIEVLFNDDLSRRQLYEALYAAAYGLSAHNKHDKATAVTEKAIALMPDDATLHLAKADFLVGCGMKQDAQKSYDRALSLTRATSDSRSVRYALELQCADRLHDLEFFEQAHSHYLVAKTELDPSFQNQPDSCLYDYAYIIDKIAWCLFKTEKKDEAKQFYLMAVELRGKLYETDPGKYRRDYFNTLNMTRSLLVELNDHKEAERIKALILKMAE